VGRGGGLVADDLRAGRPREGKNHISPNVEKCTRGVLKAPERAPDDDPESRTVTILSTKLTRLLHRSSPVDDGFLLLLLVFFPRRPRPGGFDQSQFRALTMTDMPP
jgi:hypothetical protein